MTTLKVFFKAIELRLRVIILAAHISGGVVTLLYLRFIDPLPTGSTPLSYVNPAVLVAFTVDILVLAIIGFASIRRLFLRVVRQAEQAQSMPLPELARLQRQVLNFVPQATMIQFGLWVVGGLAIGLEVAFFSQGDLPGSPDALRQIIGIIGVGGVLTTTAVYLATDLVWRRAVPLFFPNRKPSQAGGFRLSVFGRLLAIFLLIGLWPALLLARLSIERAHAMLTAPNPGAILENLDILIVFILFATTAMTFGMALLVTRSVVAPLRLLLDSVTRVERNDLRALVPVTTNDELGFVSEEFNDMLRSLDRRTRELETVYEIGKHITASLELDQILQTILREVGQIISYDAAEVCLYDEAHGVLRVRAWAGTSAVNVNTTGQDYRLDEGYTGWIGQNRQSLLVPDVDRHTAQTPVVRTIADGVSVNCYLGVPLIANQKLVGTLELISTQRSAFDEHSRQLLETIAPQVAIAIANAAQVIERERKLKDQIAALRIEIDEAKKVKSVAEITETELFKELQAKVRHIRERRSPPPT